MKCTIQAIANELELSRNTVARVLSGKSGVSDKTRKLVLKKVAEMGYKAASVSSVLSRPSIPASIVFLAGDIPQHSEFRSEIIRAVEEIVREKDFSLVLTIIDKDKNLVAELPSILFNPSVKGVIMMDVQEKHIQEAIQNRKLPVISIGASDSEWEMDTVTYNIENCLRKLLASYNKKGQTKIAWAGEIENEHGSEVFDSVNAAARMQGIELDLRLPQTIFLKQEIAEQEKFRTAVSKSATPDLFICENDWTAIRLMQTAQAAGYRIPEDFSVVGFGNRPEAAYAFPSLTSIRIPWSQIGKAAARCVLERIYDPEQPYVSVQYSADLVKRNSTI